jgi:hypothetical protein
VFSVPKHTKNFVELLCLRQVRHLHCLAWIARKRQTDRQALSNRFLKNGTLGKCIVDHFGNLRIAEHFAPDRQTVYGCTQLRIASTSRQLKVIRSTLPI